MMKIPSYFLLLTLFVLSACQIPQEKINTVSDLVPYLIELSRHNFNGIWTLTRRNIDPIEMVPILAKEKGIIKSNFSFNTENLLTTFGVALVNGLYEDFGFTSALTEETPLLNITFSPENNSLTYPIQELTLDGVDDYMFPDREELNVEISVNLEDFIKRF